MKKMLFFAGALSLALVSCSKTKQNDNVVSQQFVHKYGYAVSKEEWKENNYPGQKITHFRDGVTATESYEGGMLHGPSTYTHPDSEVVANYYLYDHGNLVKEIHYDTTGMPKNEKVILSPTRFQLTTWYKDGTPKSIEDYSLSELIEGQYFTKTNEMESRIEKGNGVKIQRDEEGLLLAKEEVEGGYTTKKETFFRNGALESLAHFKLGKLHGEKKLFSMAGEPIFVEEYINDKLHGKSTYYRNGNKQYEVSYLDGQKNGMETHFIDGGEISQQTFWENDKKHGPEVFYSKSGNSTHYYYNGSTVSKNRYDELYKLDQMIADISSEVKH